MSITPSEVSPQIAPSQTTCKPRPRPAGEPPFKLFSLEAHQFSVWACWFAEFHRWTGFWKNEDDARAWLAEEERRVTAEAMKKRLRA